MKAIVGDPLSGDARQSRGVDLATIGIRLGGTNVVNEENQNVRRILGKMTRGRQRTVGRLLHGPLRSAARFLGREWQLLLRVDRPDKRRTQGTKREPSHECGCSTAGWIVVFVIHNLVVVNSL